jgi:hypothetical protein
VLPKNNDKVGRWETVACKFMLFSHNDKMTTPTAAVLLC